MQAYLLSSDRVDRMQRIGSRCIAACRNEEPFIARLNELHSGTRNHGQRHCHLVFKRQGGSGLHSHDLGDAIFEYDF